MAVKPITPDEVVKRKGSVIPDQVIEAVNTLVAKKWTGSSATFKQDDIVGIIRGVMGVSRDTIFEAGWLDFEPVFEEAGWKVYYDKPGYCEDYNATFTFSKK